MQNLQIKKFCILLSLIVIENLLYLFLLLIMVNIISIKKEELKATMNKDRINDKSQMSIPSLIKRKRVLLTLIVLKKVNLITMKN